MNLTLSPYNNVPNPPLPTTLFYSYRQSSTILYTPNQLISSNVNLTLTKYKSISLVLIALRGKINPLFSPEEIDDESCSTARFQLQESEI